VNTHRHRLKNSVFFITLALAFVFALASASRVFAATEVEWNDTSNNGQWSITGTNWWQSGGTAAMSFKQNSAVVFGADDVPNAATLASGDEITITATGGVAIGASGTNPGMIVTGSGNWNFMFTATYTGTATGTARPANIGISGVDAGILMQGTGTLTFSTTTGYTGDTNVTAGTLRLAVANAIAKSRSVILSSTATLDLGGNNQALLALNVVSGAQVFFNSTGTNYTRLTLGNLAGDGGVFNMRVDVVAGAGDQIVLTSGSASGAHTLEFVNTSTTNPQANARSILVVSATQGGKATFNGSTEAGAYTYNVERGGDGSWYLSQGMLGNVAAAIVSSAAVAGQEWHYQLDTLYKRMGDLRQPPYGGEAAAGDTGMSGMNGAPGAIGGAGNLWLRGNFSRLNASGQLTGHGFHEYNYGATLGFDKSLGAADNMLWYVGAFAGIQRVTRSFDTDNGGNGGDGKTNTLAGGLYLTWLHSAGWYVDLVGRVDKNKNSFTAISSDRIPANASYNSNVKGCSIEFGRIIHWPQDWWIEPAVQYAAASIGGANYAATYATYAGVQQPPMLVRVNSSRASQTRFQFRFGEDGGDNPGWHPYVTLAAAYSSTNDGRVQVADENFAANYDGWRWEVGFGASYVINDRSQFYYTYEYAHATRYTRPWTFSAGYRFMW